MRTRALTSSLRWLGLIAALAGFAFTDTVHAEQLAGTALVNTLQKGGYVLLMRHAKSLWDDVRETP